MTAMRTGIHSAAISRVTAVDHFVYVFNLYRTRMKSIKNFFIVITENILENVHRTIMKE